MTDDPKAHLEALPINDVPGLFAPSGLALLAALKKADRAAYETLLQRWRDGGFARVDALDKAVDRASKSARTKQANSERPGKWPRPINYEKLNAGQAARLFLRVRPARLIKSDGVFYSLHGGLWQELKEDALRREIRATDPGDLIAPRAVGDMIKGLGDLIAVDAGPYEWIEAQGDYEPRDLILFRNGLLHWPSGTLLPLDGSYFATATPELDYDPAAECPFWLAWLSERVHASTMPTLQEIFGYIVTPDNTAHRFFCFVGPTRSGKSTAKEIAEKLVGAAHCLSKMTSDLNEPFGLQEIPEKRLLVLPDARQISRGSNKALERLLMLTGGDQMPIPRKFLGALSMKPVARVLMVCNRLLLWLDDSGALAARQIIIEFPNSFEGREDMSIPAKLGAEMSGIANWAIEGLRRLRANGYKFTVGEHSEQARRDLRRAMSPMMQFADECLTLTYDSSDFVLIRELYGHYEAWSSMVAGGDHRTRNTFTQELRATFPRLGYSKKREGKRTEYALFGVQLKTEDPTEVHECSKLRA